jgi:uncharacterized membrane protein
MFFGILGILVSLIMIIVIGALPAYFFFKHQQKSNHTAIMQLEFQALLQKGQIDAETYQKLFSLYPLPEKRNPVTLLQIVYIVGSILIGIGAILFIASNWQQMAGWFKLALAAVLSFVSFLLGDYFRRKTSRKLPVLGEGLILLGALLWGVVIIFLFQHYHWSTAYNWLLVGIWIVSLVPVILWMKSEPVFYLVIVLTFLFGIFCRDLVGQHFWIYLVLSGVLFFLSGQNRVKEGVIAGTQFIFGFTCLEHMIEAILFWLAVSLFHLLLSLWRKRHEDLIYAMVPLLLGSFFTLIFFADNWQAEQWNWIHVSFVISALLISGLAIAWFQSVPGLVMWLVSGNLFLWSYFLNQVKDSAGGYIVGKLGIILGINFIVMAFALVFQKKSKLLLGWLPMMHLLCWVPLFFLSTQGSSDVDPGYINWVTALLLLIIPLIPILFQVITAKTNPKKWPYLAFTWLCVAISLASLIWWPEYRLYIVNFALLFTIIQSFFWSYEEDQPALFYIGMVALLVFISLRYFDLFWSMRNRSVFFIIGGVLLVGIAVIIERQRHRLDKAEEKHENS